MLCKNCERYDSISGMKWGICDRRRQEPVDDKRVAYIITGPNYLCKYDKRKKADGKK